MPRRRSTHLRTSGARQTCWQRPQVSSISTCWPVIMRSRRTKPTTRQQTQRVSGMSGSAGILPQPAMLGLRLADKPLGDFRILVVLVSVVTVRPNRAHSARHDVELHVEVTNRQRQAQQALSKRMDGWIAPPSETVDQRASGKFGNVANGSCLSICGRRLRVGDDERSATVGTEIDRSRLPYHGLYDVLSLTSWATRWMDYQRRLIWHFSIQPGFR